MIRFVAIAVSLTAIASPASADLTANYTGVGGALSIRIEVATNGDVRGATSDPNNYFIARDGHGYMVKASFDGPAVMRVEDMAAVLMEQMKRLMPKLPSEAQEVPPAFDLVNGGSVTIRGRQGVAYYMGKQADRLPTEQPILVISKDPKLAPFGVAMQRQFDMSVAQMGHMFGRSNPFQAMQDILKTGTPLVFTGMELDTVDDGPIPDARFVLPAAPLSIEAVRKNMGAPAR